eukprot:gene6992-7206_t
MSAHFMSKLAETVGAGPKAEPAGLAATPARNRGAAAMAAADGSKASPATPQSAPRSAFKARTNRGQVVATLHAHIPRASGDEEESLFVGRVVCEVEGGHLNDTAVVLEGDSASSEGARVGLDLSSTASFRLFPGQVIAVRGVNPSGSRIMARSIWTHLPPPNRSSGDGSCTTGCNGAAPMDVDGSSAGTGLGSSGGLSAVVAAGPFCLSDDLAFDPLHELLQELKLRPPNLLVLLGPFVDVEQPLIGGGMIDVAYHQLFQTQVIERLQAWQSALPGPCQVVLMPSVRDVFHHPTFPQPAFNLPADQRRMYPLYPAPPGTCLDLTGDAVLHLQQLPELMLLPSDLAPFAKLVPAGVATAAGGSYAPIQDSATPGSQVVVINPGRLAKGSSGGTYAHITVAEGSGTLASRCRVDLVRV